MVCMVHKNGNHLADLYVPPYTVQYSTYIRIYIIAQSPVNRTAAKKSSVTQLHYYYTYVVHMCILLFNLFINCSSYTAQLLEIKSINYVFTCLHCLQFPRGQFLFVLPLQRLLHPNLSASRLADPQNRLPLLSKTCLHVPYRATNLASSSQWKVEFLN